MATDNLKDSGEELPLTTTGEPTDQLTPEESDVEDDDDLAGEDELNNDQSGFDDVPLDDEDDLDEDEVKRLFPGEDASYSDNDDAEDEEPNEGIRHDNKEDEGLVDDNMSGMPVVPSPS